MTDDARAIIDRLALVRHPEGGWYRETWRAAIAADGPAGRASDGAAQPRAGGTAILFLLEQDERSHWHKVDAAELWFWHAGAPLTLMTAATDAGPVASVTLGADILAGQSSQAIVPPHHWQAAVTRGGWALVSCVVVPAFDFAGFTLADPDWAPG